ncbi:dynein light chain Tctex-type 5-like, partial [Saccostrea cucullata]|uniref:dynein light chain Tctex-type 5-like n=1 Tax=Saccostrea cuccullata TaxID=36930 RepID=UPI002ED31F12
RHSLGYKAICDWYNINVRLMSVSDIYIPHLLGVKIAFYFYIFSYLKALTLDSTTTIPKVMFHRDNSEEKDDEVFAGWKQRRVSLAKSSDDGSKATATVKDGKAPEKTTRRRSTFKGVANSINSLLSIRRMSKYRLSISNPEDGKPKVRYENTYKMKPDEDKKVSTNKIEIMVKSILNHFLEKETYSASSCSKLACDLSILIKNKVKELGLPRYKIICNVIISQKDSQSMQTASRCLWDTTTDTFSQVTYSNTSLCAVVTVHCVYFE